MKLTHADRFYIGGVWVEPSAPRFHDVINPATEAVVATVSMGDSDDVDAAVAAAAGAFPSYSAWTPAQRIALLEEISSQYRRRMDEFADIVRLEIGSPRSFSAQVTSAPEHFRQAAETLESYEFEVPHEGYVLRREPIGVCGLITPWNWPVNQIVTKLAYALAAGCTAVIKPSENSPLSALLLMEVMHSAGVPEGVVNLINGDGASVGRPIAAHPGIELVSFTGSTRAGIAVAEAAARTVKRVCQELGGKSPSVILDDADLSQAVRWTVSRAFLNSGQSCQAPTRMLVHSSRMAEAAEAAREIVAAMRVGDPALPETTMGPVVNHTQFGRIQAYIEGAIAEGVSLICGGPGRPEGLDRGYFVRPTVFSGVTPDMTIAREEIFGPVLAIIPFETDEEAVDIANGTEYGLAGYVFSGDGARGRRIASRIRAGRVTLNGAASSLAAPMGGYRRSGNGRELGRLGFESFLEVKALMGA